MANIREIPNREELELFQSSNMDALHILKIGAEWCGPCQTLDSTLRSLDKERIGDAVFGSIMVDTDETEDIADAFDITTLPVLLYMKNDTVLGRTVGAISAEEIYNKIAEFN